MPKPFSFSYSKIKNFETCPRRYYGVDVTKKFKEEEGEALRWGNQVHKALANRIGKGIELPEPMKQFEDMCLRLLSVQGKHLVEQQLAINANFGACEWFGKDAWFRAIADLLVINPPVALAIDYKTGKIVEDSQQLALMAATVFAHHPDIHAIRTEFWWLKDDAVSRNDFRRTDMPAMWRHVWPKIEQLRHAHETLEFPPKPGYLCRKYCPVTDCPHHGG